METQTQTVTDPTEAVFAELPAIFRECCDPETTRYQLGMPFVIDDHIYATDGRIVVRCRATMAWVELVVLARPAGARYPKTAPELFVGNWGDPIAIPDLPPAPPCESCNGTKETEYVTCDCCGTTIATPGHFARCFECEGTGLKAMGLTRVNCGPVDFAHRYLSILKRHNATLYPNATDPAESAGRFTLPDGAEGLLMPLKPEKG